MSEDRVMKRPDLATTDSWYDIGRYAPWLVLALSLTITYLLWQNAHSTSIQEQRIGFNSEANDIGDRIHRRIEYYEQVLHGVRAFYLNQHEMEHAEFTGYISSLEIDKNFPGIQGVSFAPLVSDAHKSAHIASQRSSGLSGYTIQPEGKRPSYAPVAYIEPRNLRNARVLGFDNLSSPTRKATIEQARDEDRAVISEKLVLKQTSDQPSQAGFLMFLPVFQHGAAHDSLAARRANIDGWFAASFHMSDLMVGILDEYSQGLSINIFDEGVISEQNLMCSFPEGVSQRPSPHFTTVVPVEIAGHKWSVQVSSLPGFEVKRDKQAEVSTMVVGGLLSLLLPLIVWLLVGHRRRVIHMTSAFGRELVMRTQAEQKSHDLSLFNEAILESSPAGIAVYMDSGPCVMANEAYARAIGGTVGEVLKQDFRNNASWQRNGLLDCAVQAFETGLTIRRDIEGVTSFGKKVVVECIFASINISEKRHLLLIVNDVSDRAEAQSALTESMHQLEQKELSKTRFLAAAGHDLRQPMAAANLFLDALKLTESTPHQSDIIKRLDQSLQTFNGLLDALLNISKLDAGTVKPEYTSINVAEIFNWLEQNFSPITSGKQLDFRLYFPLKERLVVRSDIGLLNSVLMNLVSNAVKFTAKGAILVSARRRGGSVLFQVWDTGIGIPDEYIKHIFDEFYQINNPQRDRTSGLGLGLSITKRAMTLLGGEISCRSQIGRGSVFAFRLPLDDTPTGMTRQDVPVVLQEDTVNESFARNKRFVVVEDDALVAQAMVNWLEGMGGEVKCFHSTADALHHANIECADFYIADYMLGGALNGIQFLNLIRQKRGQPVNAVLMTGDTSTTFIRQAEECDWPVLHKPINTSKLISALGVQARNA